LSFVPVNICLFVSQVEFDTILNNCQNEMLSAATKYSINCLPLELDWIYMRVL